MKDFNGNLESLKKDIHLAVDRAVTTFTRMSESSSGPHSLYYPKRQIFAEDTVKISRRKKKKLDRVQVSNSPLEIKFSKRKFNELVGYLSLLVGLERNEYWYYLLFFLEKHFKGNCQFYWLAALCTSADEDLLFERWLYRSEWIDARTYFGTILTTKSLVELLQSVNIHFERSCKPKRKIRRRGYNDKGSRAPDDVRKRRSALSNDWTESLEERIQELRENLQTKDISRLKNYLRGVGYLDDEELLKFRLIRKEHNHEQQSDSLSGNETSDERREFKLIITEEGQLREEYRITESENRETEIITSELEELRRESRKLNREYQEIIRKDRERLSKQPWYRNETFVYSERTYRI